MWVLSVFKPLTFLAGKCSGLKEDGSRGDGEKENKEALLPTLTLGLGSLTLVFICHQEVELN